MIGVHRGLNAHRESRGYEKGVQAISAPTT